MRTAVEKSETEFFLLPAVSIYDDNWGRRTHKWAVFIYFLNYCLEVHF